MLTEQRLSASSTIASEPCADMTSDPGSKVAEHGAVGVASCDGCVDSSEGIGM